MSDTSGPKISEKEGLLFYSILANAESNPQTNWDAVATQCSYTNAKTAKTRFSQILARINKDSSGAPATPKKSEVGSGTNTTPSKVTKPKTPRKKKVDVLDSENIEGKVTKAAPKTPRKKKAAPVDVEGMFPVLPVDENSKPDGYTGNAGIDFA